MKTVYVGLKDDFIKTIKDELFPYVVNFTGEDSVKNRFNARMSTVGKILFKSSELSILKESFVVSDDIREVYSCFHSTIVLPLIGTLDVSGDASLDVSALELGKIFGYDCENDRVYLNSPIIVISDKYNNDLLEFKLKL